MNNENKNIYDMLNDIEINLDEYEKDDFTDIEKMKLKKEFRKNIKSKPSKNYKKYISVASILLIVVGIVYQTKLGAYAYSAISDITENIKIGLGIEEELDKYTTNIKQSITKRKITVKINEVLLDGDELIVSLTQKYDGELKKNERLYLISENLYINGKKINHGSKGYSTIINKNTEEFIIGYKLDKEHKGDINVKLRIMDAGIQNGDSHEYEKRIIGPWTFKFKVNGEELINNTKDIKLNKEVKLDTGAILYLENYKSNVINQKINLKITDHKKEIKLDESVKGKVEYGQVLLKGKDNLGNKVGFRPGSGYMQEGFSEYEYDKESKQFDRNAKKLYLTPYIQVIENNNEEYKTSYKKVGEEFIIDLENNK